MQTKRVKRPVNGVLLLDKPEGPTSNAALQQVKRLYQAAKAGHTGSLDPIATGLLPICLGEATKFSQFLLDADKTYQAVIVLGKTTTTGDIEGEVTGERPVNVTQDQLNRTLRRFVGEITQVPPMYSALKHQGKALYRYAREGTEVARTPRRVTIYSIEVNAFGGNELSVTVACSKGTYLRVLAEDIGQALGCGAFLRALRRTKTGRFDICDAITLDRLEAMRIEERDAQLLPIDCLVETMDKVVLEPESAHYFLQGCPVWQPKIQVRDAVRVYGAKNEFLGVGFITDEGKIAPKRLVVASAHDAGRRILQGEPGPQQRIP